MEDIEIGEYVRTENGIIARVKKINHLKGFLAGTLYITDRETQYVIDKLNIIKHSFNIIDLTEVGDYVTEKEVLDIYISNDKWEPIEIRIDSKYINYYTEEDIQTILTKEAFKNNCYKMGE